jgi:hypothetical protein
MKETYQRQCLWCAKDFESAREDAIFHSQACKQAYWRWKQGLNLECARIKASLEQVMTYTRRPETADQAWTAIYSLKEDIEWMLAKDEVGTRKLHS